VLQADLESPVTGIDVRESRGKQLLDTHHRQYQIWIRDTPFDTTRHDRPWRGTNIDSELDCDWSSG